ncbi:MAG: hypothetical protein LBK59_00870 [Bifidobacteriaceae bacterium]|jgi:hypothetical protein|nr:hypothetical protein [Bifidobacteriaceae bacterium]
MANGNTTAKPNAMDASGYAAQVICPLTAIFTIGHTPAAMKQATVKTTAAGLAPFTVISTPF